MKVDKVFFKILFIISALASVLVFFLADRAYVYLVFVHLGIFSIAMYFLFEKNIKFTLKKLGLFETPKKIAYYTIGGLILLFIMNALVVAGAGYFGLNDQKSIGNVVDRFPWYILITAFAIAPISEELFFRGLLAGRLGVVVSSAVFAVAHIAYGSIVELLGAFFIGMVLALIYRHSKSIVPCILIHAIFNLGSLIVIKLFYGY